MPSAISERQPVESGQITEARHGSHAGKKLKRVRIPLRDRPTRGRVMEALLVGVLTQTAIAMFWLASNHVQRPIYSLLFVLGIASAAVAAQRRLEGMARLIWSLTGAFWASLAFWVVSVPLTLRSNPGFRGMSCPLFMARDGWYSASDLLPVVMTALTIGVVAGVAGWIVWSWRASRELQADIYAVSSASVEELPPAGRAPTRPPIPLAPSPPGYSDSTSSSPCLSDLDDSRDRWGPPPDLDSPT